MVRKKERRILACIIAAGLILMIYPSSIHAGSLPQDARPVLLGAYEGNQGFDMAKVAAMEKWQAKKFAVVNLFTNWANDKKVIDNLFTIQLPAIWNNGNIPMITWEPFTPPATPPDIEVRIASGEFDSYIQNWAKQLKKFLSGPDRKFGTTDDRRVYLRLGHEMNGNWYPWSAAVGGNTPADFVNMWIHVRSIFLAQGLKAKHVQWVWCVNHQDVGDFAAEEFFPGDANIDWLAIDAFNWGASQSWSQWLSLAESCDEMASRLRGISKRPLALTEVASTSVIGAGNDPVSKGQWIVESLQYVVENQFGMVIWFNQDKESDWAVFGGRFGTETTLDGKQAYSEYRISVSDPHFVSPDPANPRLISNSLFAGTETLLP